MRSLLAPWTWIAVPSLLLLLPLTAVWAATQQPGSFNVVGYTNVSAMMMFLGNEEKVYIIDKVEGNPTQINGHPAWAAEWDIATSEATPMEMSTNAFCAAGMHLPNGSYYVFGGNGAIGPGGNIGSVRNPDQVSGAFDVSYQDWDGARAVRVINPCTDRSCGWYDNSTFLAMARKRWYPAAEALADGSVVLVGGFVNGGYVNRNFPNNDPRLEGGAAEPTYEFFPPRGAPVEMQFMTDTSGLNAYALLYLMPSGNIFAQANLSTILWNVTTNVETPLPPMPNGVVRVYPASGASAMLPLTPTNNYTPTIIFCGGSNMSADGYGDYSNPAIDTWLVPASNDCQRITPEPTDSTSAVAYVQDDDMPQGRTMGQFIMLPDMTLLMINGGANGTAGYAAKTGTTPAGSMPFGMSLATAEVMKPAIYDPSKPPGQRWSDAGLQSSTIPRLYHSSALLLPDASVLVAGSNPNVDYNVSVTYPTEYRAERFYPPYFKATTRPQVSGIPTGLTYGGDSFDLTVTPQSYAGSGNDAAGNTTVVLLRPGWTTHGMNMGQRLLQLNNTFTVKDDGSIVLHVAQPPPNPNLLQPGPVLVFVVIHGIPSIGKMVIVGNGQVAPQPVSAASVLPISVLSSKGAAGSASSSSTGSGKNTGKLSTGLIVAVAMGGVAVAAIGSVFACVLVSRRRHAAAARKTIMGGIVRSTSMGRGYRDFKGATESSTAFNEYEYQRGGRGSGSGSESGFIPLQQYSQADLHAAGGGGGGGGGHGGQGGYGVYRDVDGYGRESTQSFNPYDEMPVQPREEGQRGGGGTGAGAGPGGGGGGGHSRYI